MLDTFSLAVLLSLICICSFKSSGFHKGCINEYNGLVKFLYDFSRQKLHSESVSSDSTSAICNKNNLNNIINFVQWLFKAVVLHLFQ